jgi:hypothetical protein
VAAGTRAAAARVRPPALEDSEAEQAEYGVESGIDYPRPMLDIEARCEEMQ